MRIEGLSRLNDSLKSLRKMVSRPEDGLSNLAELMASKARELAPVYTGRLKNSIKVSRERRNRICVLAEAPYSGFVEFGTRPHIIRPRQKQVLRFEADGKVVYATRVYHPGAGPKPFFRPAFQYAAEKVSEIMLRGMARCL